MEQFKGAQIGSNKADQKIDQKADIVELIKQNPTISRSEMAQKLNIHESSVKRRIESLISSGIIRRVGPDKGGHWEVIVP